MTVNDRNSNRFAAINVTGLGLYLFSRTVTYSRSMTITTYHRRAGQQGPTRTLTAALKRVT